MTTYDTNTPLGTETPTLGDDKIRDAKAAIQEREHVDHYWPLTGTEVSHADKGKHQRVCFIDPANVVAEIVTPGTNEAFLITKADTNSELYFTNDGGSEVQLTVFDTPNTVLNVTAAAIEAAKANILDAVTLNATAGVISVQNDSLTGDKCNQTAEKFIDDATLEWDTAGANDFIKAKVPTKGSGAEANFLPVCAYGTYTGDGNAGKTITAFGAGINVRRVEIRSTDAAGSGHSAVVAFEVTAGTHGFKTKNLDLVGDISPGTSALVITNNTFIVDGTATNGVSVNESASTYYWFAIGEWAT
jgi:hypothetical protein